MSKKKKVTDLTEKEKRLLEYPPTKETWICKCGLFNLSTTLKCIICATEATGKLAWPLYLNACKKVGIEPLSAKWKLHEKNGYAIIFTKGAKRWMKQEVEEVN